jgi:hypothetical protein
LFNAARVQRCCEFNAAERIASAPASLRASAFSVTDLIVSARTPLVMSFVRFRTLTERIAAVRTLARQWFCPPAGAAIRYRFTALPERKPPRECGLAHQA